jgi:hypothetical protein
MQDLTTDLVGKACAIFLRYAYPGGEAAVPAKKRGYLDLPPGQALAEFLRASPDSLAICQTLSAKQGGPGYALRLGCAAFPHLKLKVQWLGSREPGMWVFAVDTHDAFSSDCFSPPPGHPEAEAWRRLQIGNQHLKEQIERAWAAAGLMTFNGLLRNDLEKPPA